MNMHSLATRELDQKHLKKFVLTVLDVFWHFKKIKTNSENYLQTLFYPCLVKTYRSVPRNKGKTYKEVKKRNPFTRLK